MNYSTLVADNTVKGSIKYWVNYSRLDPDEILLEAQAWISQRLRVRQMTSVADISILTGTSSVAFPTGYLDPVHLGIPGLISSITLKDEEWFRANLGFDSLAALPVSMPTIWSDIGQVMQFNSLADQDYTAKFTFFKTPTPLSIDNETNWLTDRYPTLLRRVCTMFGEEALKNYDAMDRTEARAMAAISDIKIESDMARRGMELDFNWDEN